MKSELFFNFPVINMLGELLVEIKAVLISRRKLVKVSSSTSLTNLMLTLFSFLQQLYYNPHH
jgi:hypothetical protein